MLLFEAVETVPLLRFLRCAASRSLIRLTSLTMLSRGIDRGDVLGFGTWFGLPSDGESGLRDDDEDATAVPAGPAACDVLRLLGASCDTVPVKGDADLITE